MRVVLDPGVTPFLNAESIPTSILGYVYSGTNYL
jgi:hypothetical protein